jgi:hypothetical protein
MVTPQPTNQPPLTTKKFSQRKFHHRKSRQKIKESSADKYAQMQKVQQNMHFCTPPTTPHEMPLSAHHTPSYCLRPFYNRNPSPPMVPCHAPPPTSPPPHMPHSPSLSSPHPPISSTYSPPLPLMTICAPPLPPLSYLIPFMTSTIYPPNPLPPSLSHTATRWQCR